MLGAQELPCVGELALCSHLVFLCSNDCVLSRVCTVPMTCVEQSVDHRLREGVVTSSLPLPDQHSIMIVVCSVMCRLSVWIMSIVI